MYTKSLTFSTPDTSYLLFLGCSYEFSAYASVPYTSRCISTSLAYGLILGVAICILLYTLTVVPCGSILACGKEGTMEHGSKELMRQVTLDIMAAYRAGTPFSRIAADIAPRIPWVRKVTSVWVKNYVKRLRDAHLLTIQERRLAWSEVIDELKAERNAPRQEPGRSSPDVPEKLLLPEARAYKPENDSATSGVEEGFQRLSVIARTPYVGQLLAYKNREHCSMKDIVDEALRIWVKVKAQSASRRCSTDEVVDTALRFSQASTEE